MNATEDSPEPTEIEALLPWHAAGTLDPSEKRMVEDAIARDPELARRYAAVREEFNADWQINEGLGAPSPRAMDQLFAKIDAEPKRRGAASSSSSFDIAAAWAGFIDRLSSRTRAVTAAVAGFLVIAEAGLLAVMGTSAPVMVTSYSTASGPSATAPAQGAYVLVRFAPDAKAVEITRLLAANDATIASGPTTEGFYRLQVSKTPLPKDKLAGIARHLEQDKTFEFVSVSE
jgi:anti-sigma-K factor RskA